MEGVECCCPQLWIWLERNNLRIPWNPLTRHPQRKQSGEDDSHISVVKVSEVIQQLFIGLTGVGVSLLKKGDRRMFSFSRIPLLSFSEKVNIRAYSRWDFTYWSILNFRWKDAVFILVVDLEKLFSHVPWGVPWGGIQGYVVSGLLSQDIWVLYSCSGWWSLTFVSAFADCVVLLDLLSHDL